MKTSPKQNDPQRPLGVNSDPDWKDAVESEKKYESQRFDSSPKARRRHQRDERLLREFLQTLPSGQLVLDAPSGQGRFTEVIQQSGHRVMAMEINYGRIRDASRRIGGTILGVQEDVLHVPCAGQMFDAAVFFRLFHHLNLDIVPHVLKELCRVSRRAFVTFYNRNTWNYYRQRLEGKTQIPSTSQVSWSKKGFDAPHPA